MIRITNSVAVALGVRERLIKSLTFLVKKKLAIGEGGKGTGDRTEEFRVATKEYKSDGISI